MRSSCLRLLGQHLELPVNGLRLDVEVQQDLASVTLYQSFINDTSDVIEVEYLFPIPADASLSSFCAYIEGKCIEAQVKEKEQARENFVDALASGRPAFLGEITELNDVIAINIGNIHPKAEVTIEVTYVTECRFEDGRWRLIIPLVVLPRFASSGREDAPSNYLQEWEFACRIKASSQLQNVEVNLQHSIQQPDPLTMLIEAKAIAIPGNDIDLSFTTEDTTSPFALVQRDSNTGALGFHFSFQLCLSKVNLLSFDPVGEFVLLLDRSGSMRGDRITTAKLAVEYFIKSLPENSLFNIVSFGTAFNKLFPDSQAYSTDTVEYALKAVKSFNADMSSTNIFSPLEDVLKTPTKSSFPRYVYLITDGQVANVDSIVDLVEQNHRCTRVSTIGIGSGVSRQLIDEVAGAGKGTSILILDSSQINQGILNSLEKSLQPTLSDIYIDWLAGEPSCVNPSRPFYCFNGDRVSFNAIVSSLPVAFNVHYFDSLKGTHKQLEFTIPDAEVSTGRLAVAQAVRSFTGSDLEVSMAVRYNVLSKATSLIAVGYGGVLEAYSSPVTYSCTLMRNSRLTPKGKQYNSSVPRASRSSPRVIQVDGRTIQVSQITTSKTGKHGSAKAFIIGIDQETGARFETVVMSSELTQMTLPTAKDGLSLMQNTNGSWSLTPELEAALAPFLPCSIGQVLVKYATLSNEVVLTMLVLAVLTEGLNSDEAPWRLIAIKGTRWLKHQKVEPLTLSELTSPV